MTLCVANIYAAADAIIQSTVIIIILALLFNRNLYLYRIQVSLASGLWVPASVFFIIVIIVVVVVKEMSSA